MRRLLALVSIALGAAVAACGPSPVAGPTIVPTSAASAATTFAGSSPSIAPSLQPNPTATFQVPSTGFAFDAESVVAYYETRGYVCGPPGPSTQAAGYLYRSCQLVDGNGRTLTVGVVTDQAGDLADGFASVRAKAGEAILAPTDALEPLAGMLGAMLGEVRATALLPWLAGHLGDEYAQTTAADLHVATYTAKPGDHTTLVVEVGNDAYLASPRPSPS